VDSCPDRKLSVDVAQATRIKKHWMRAFPSRDDILMVRVEALTVINGSSKSFANSLPEFRWCCCRLDEFGFAPCAVLFSVLVSSSEPQRHQAKKFAAKATP
jgi:hypothetical protein